MARAWPRGGAAIAKEVGKIIDKGKKIAGYLLEADEQDIEFAAGKFTVSGTDRRTTFGEVAGAAYFPPDAFPLDILDRRV
jgi:carbon-monoxide dehydrogenase large subunit